MSSASTILTLAVIIVPIVLAILGLRFFLKRMKKRAVPAKQLKTYIRGQLRIVRDPVLVRYKTNPEVYGVSNDVAISASILRTRVQIWKTILIVIIAALFGYLAH